LIETVLGDVNLSGVIGLETCVHASVRVLELNRMRLLAPLLVALGTPMSAAMAQPAVQGQWSTLTNLAPINPIHAALLPTGNVLIVAGSGNCPPSQAGCPAGPPYGPPNGSGAALYYPGAKTFWPLYSPYDMFCNGMVVLYGGRALIAGGTTQYDPFDGASNTSLFDTSTSTWINVQPMAHGRWYPTLITLSNGRVMTFSGLDENDNTNSTVEIYDPASNIWSSPQAAGWTPPLYPRMHLLPNGKVFYSGSGTSSALFDPSLFQHKLPQYPAVRRAC
jgi:hypothetical protein